MMANLLPPAPNPPGRMSQLLPSVKCSDCNFPVPLDELGSHVCATPPSVPTLPKPSTTPSQATSLLPARLQNLVNSTGSTPNDRDQPRRISGDRPRINTSGFNSSSPISASPSRAPQSPFSRPPRDPFASPGPLPPPPSFRERSNSNASSARSASPGTARPFTANPMHQSFAQPPPRMMTPTITQQRSPPTPQPLQQRLPTPKPLQQRRPSPGPLPLALQPQPTMQRLPPSPVSTPHEEPDTKIGGEAGMAGVGRRGFAAAARAAMFTTRAEHPRFIDIDADNRSMGTPPLSPGSSYSSQSPGVSPYPRSPVQRHPSPPRQFMVGLPSGPKSPNLAQSPGLSFTQSPAITPKAPEPIHTRKASSLRSVGLPASPRGARPMSHKRTASASSGSDYGGLAYADSTDDERAASPQVLAGSIKRSSSREPESPPRSSDPPSRQIRADSVSSAATSDSGGVAAAFGFGARTSTSSSSYTHMTGPTGPKASGHSRKNTSGGSSASGSLYSRGLSLDEPVGGLAGLAKLENAMETLMEDSETTPRATTHERNQSVASSARRPSRTSEDEEREGAKTQRSKTVSSPETKGAKLPARSKTTIAKEHSPTEAQKSVRKVKSCLKCSKNITDGRWVKMDSGGILCEQCWKNLYLPKCRRCNLPIEKQAVSSSDGQLKGKYHKDCFNCHTCQKPFPDKSFYVFDGKPLCAYHYHEENDSLCAAATCGQPIEGPCAVSHAGDRYHPEHMLCEYPGIVKCRERLVDYFEVDGRMLCERHAKMSRLTDGMSDSDTDDGWVESARAMKRRTKFIDLTGGGKL